MHPPKGLPVRPTTDFAKEGLFNILNNVIDLAECRALDLFCGTGNISLELSSRGCIEVTSVDSNRRCVQFLNATAEQWQLNIHTVKEDVFKFLKAGSGKFDLIFADPPYDMANIQEIHSLVFSRALLNENGILIIEHSPRLSLQELEGIYDTRKYGNVNFSFFRK
jgi:16S rRNA (guanine966-N2)-methyltransferase